MLHSGMRSPHVSRVEDAGEHLTCFGHGCASWTNRGNSHEWFVLRVHACLEHHFPRVPPLAMEDDEVEPFLERFFAVFNFYPREDCEIPPEALVRPTLAPTPATPPPTQATTLAASAEHEPPSPVTPPAKPPLPPAPPPPPPRAHAKPESCDLPSHIASLMPVPQGQYVGSGFKRRARKQRKCAREFLAECGIPEESCPPDVLKRKIVGGKKQTPKLVQKYLQRRLGCSSTEDVGTGQQDRSKGAGKCGAKGADKRNGKGDGKGDTKGKGKRATASGTARATPTTPTARTTPRRREWAGCQGGHSDECTVCWHF